MPRYDLMTHQQLVRLETDVKCRSVRFSIQEELARRKRQGREETIDDHRAYLSATELTG